MLEEVYIQQLPLHLVGVCVCGWFLFVCVLRIQGCPFSFAG